MNERSGFQYQRLQIVPIWDAGIDIPYFWNIADDKDITFTPRLHSSNEPLYLAEYRQDFAQSSLIVDTGYTEGYKKKGNTKTPGSRTHFFSRFYINY